MSGNKPSKMWAAFNERGELRLETIRFNPSWSGPPGWELREVAVIPVEELEKLREENERLRVENQQLKEQA